MSNRVTSSVVSCFLLAACASVDPVREIVREEMVLQKLPGASIAIVEDGRIVRAEGFGFANLEHAVPATEHTVYQSGSVGKQFTAALVMLLVQDGRIALDDPIGRHLPGTPASWERITIRQLLTHTSGLADPYEALDLTRNYTEEELLAIDARVPVLFEPGARFSYSNMGYHVLGFLCSRVGGKFYADQLVERVFRPAGMTTARLIDEHDLVPRRAAGYEYEGDTPRNQRWVSPTLNTTADGSVYLTVLDMAAWDLALTRGAPIASELQAAMRASAALSDGKRSDYGFGWALAPFEGRAAISHGGAWQGFTTYYLRLPDEQLSVIVFTNRSGAKPETIARRIAVERLRARGP